jgi:aminoglycoside phosphotransferase (APT) family kinase protein
MTTDTTSPPDGIDVAPVTKWLAARMDGLRPPLRFTKLTGGHSNFTYRVDDEAGTTFVLRRPPLGELLPSAHDMGREFRVISALWPTAVPVAQPLAHCDDPSVTGAPFYCMSLVDGRALYAREDVDGYVPEARRHDLAMSFIDVLADLHAVDPDEVGLGGLGKKEDYVARQLHRWHASWNASKTDDRPLADTVHDLLVERIPVQEPARVVHGDYGLHNCLSHPRGRIAAVVDWEISTLGDPLADLGYALNSWCDADDPDPLRAEVPTRAPGFPPKAELLRRYAERTGRDVSGIGFYESFNHWKTFCILQGVYARYLHGQKSTEGVDLENLTARRDRALEQAADGVGAA